LRIDVWVLDFGVWGAPASRSDPPSPSPQPVLVSGSRFRVAFFVFRVRGFVFRASRSDPPLVRVKAT